MRIALVTEFYYPHVGGVTEHVHNLAQEFARLGHHVTILTSNMAGQQATAAAIRQEPTARVLAAADRLQGFPAAAPARSESVLIPTGRRVRPALERPELAPRATVRGPAALPEMRAAGLDAAAEDGPARSPGVPGKGAELTRTAAHLRMDDGDAMPRGPASDPAERVLLRRIGKSWIVFNNGSFSRFTTGVRLEHQVRDILRRDRIDVVHVHVALVPGLGMSAPEAAHRCGIPVVATFHSWFPRQPVYRMFRHPLQRRLDRIAAKIAVSEPVVWAMSRYFEAEWGIIPNGVDVSYFQPNGRLPEAALKTGPRLLFLGRLDPRNGLDTVLAAMPRILQRFPATELVVAGDGPLRRYYEKRARHLGDRVRFVGRVYDERPGCYASADLYVCPTTKASFGITLLEAMASGTPVVASDIIGFRELVDGGKEAALVPHADPSAWAATVIRLLEDPERRAVMGRAGQEKAGTFAWPGIARRVLRVYERVTR